MRCGERKRNAGRHDGDGPRGLQVERFERSLETAAATAAGRHQLVELGLLGIREERLDRVVPLGGDRRHLRARISVAAARRFHQRRRLGRRSLHDRVGLGEDRVRDLERILDDRHRIATTATAPRPPPPPLRLRRRRRDREQRGRHHSHANHLLHCFCPQGSVELIRRACIRRVPGHNYRRTATSAAGAPRPAQRQASWRQQLSRRPLAQTIKTAILTRPSAGRLHQRRARPLLQARTKPPSVTLPPNYCCMPSVAPEVFEFTFLLNKDISIFPNL